MPFKRVVKGIIMKKGRPRFKEAFPFLFEGAHLFELSLIKQN